MSSISDDHHQQADAAPPGASGIPGIPVAYRGPEGQDVSPAQEEVMGGGGDELLPTGSSRTTTAAQSLESQAQPQQREQSSIHSHGSISISSGHNHHHHPVGSEARDKGPSSTSHPASGGDGGSGSVPAAAAAQPRSGTPPTVAAGAMGTSPMAAPQLQQWSTSFFEGISMDWAAFADSLLCPYCISSAHFNTLYREQSGMYLPLCCGLLAADCCWFQAFYMCIATQLHTFVVRRQLRRRYGIWQMESQKHSFWLILLDVLLACVCTPCSIAQHHRMMTSEGQWPGPVVFSRSMPSSTAPSITIIN